MFWNSGNSLDLVAFAGRAGSPRRTHGLHGAGARHNSRRPLPPRVAGEKDSLVRSDSTQFDKTPVRLVRQVNKILTPATLRTGQITELREGGRMKTIRFDLTKSFNSSHAAAVIENFLADDMTDKQSTLSCVYSRLPPVLQPVHVALPHGLLRQRGCRDISVDPKRAGRVRREPCRLHFPYLEGARQRQINSDDQPMTASR